MSRSLLCYWLSIASLISFSLSATLNEKNPHIKQNIFVPYDIEEYEKYDEYTDIEDLCEEGNGGPGGAIVGSTVAMSTVGGLCGLTIHLIALCTGPGYALTAGALTVATAPITKALIVGAGVAGGIAGGVATGPL